MTESAVAQTVGEMLARCRAALADAGIESAALDARLLVGEALKLPVERIIAWPEQAVPADAAARLDGLLRRRLARQPMSHILGRREFWSLEFQVTPDVLTPRPDSETLIEAVLDRIKDRSRGVRIADLGVGSGCLLLALLNELPNATGLGIDRSPAALVVARENAKQLGLAARVEWREGDWLHGVSERFDVIVSNPPYIASGTLAALEPELRYEPRAALDGGLDGLDAYRTSAPMLAAALSADGIVALEIGHDQGDAVAAILEQAGLDVRARRADLSGRERCLVAAASLR